MVSDHLAQGLLAKVTTIRMVAELGLRARLPSFSPSPHARFSTTMDMPVIGSFLQPPMANWEDNTTPLQSLINMGTVGVLVLQGIKVAGGRIVQGIYNRLTKEVQLIYDRNGQFVDFTALEDQQLQPTTTTYDPNDDKPTTPRPPQSSGENVGGYRAAADPADGSITSAIQIFDDSQGESPDTSETPVANLSATFRNAIDEQTRRDRERIGLGKQGARDYDDILKMNILLKKKQQYEDRGTVTRISSNACPENSMKDLANKLPQWAHTAIQT